MITTKSALKRREIGEHLTAVLKNMAAPWMRPYVRGIILLNPGPHTAINLQVPELPKVIERTKTNDPQDDLHTVNCTEGGNVHVQSYM